MRLLVVLLFVPGLAMPTLGSRLLGSRQVIGDSPDLDPEPTHCKSVNGTAHESHTEPIHNTPGTVHTPTTTTSLTKPTDTGSIDRPYGGPRTSLKPSAWTTGGASGSRPSGSPRAHGTGLMPSGATSIYATGVPKGSPTKPHGPVPTGSWITASPHTNGTISPTRPINAPKPTGTNRPHNSHPAWNDYTDTPHRPTNIETDRPEAGGKNTSNDSPATATGPTNGEAGKRAANGGGPPCPNPQVNPNPPFNFLCPGDEGYCDQFVLNDKPPYGLICEDEK